MSYMTKEGARMQQESAARTHKWVKAGLLALPLLAEHSAAKKMLENAIIAEQETATHLYRSGRRLLFTLLGDEPWAHLEDF